MSTSRQISAAYIFEHFPLGLAYAADQKKRHAVKTRRHANMIVAQKRETNDTKRNKKKERKRIRHRAHPRPRIMPLPKKKKKKNTRNGDTSYSPAPPTQFLHTSTEQNYGRKHMTIYTHTLSPHTNAFPRGQREIREEFVQVKNALVPMEHTANLSISSRVIRVNMVHRRGKSHGLTWASVWR
jgi:hypothetical protein